MSSLSTLLNYNTLLVKEKAGLFKAAREYEFFDEQGNKVGEAKEESGNIFKKFLKAFTNLNDFMGFTINFYDVNGQKVITIKRGFTLLFSKILVEDGNGILLGKFQQKFALLKFNFLVFDKSEAQIANLIGDWKGWDFKIVDSNNKEMAHINKKWAGLAKELFTSADNYVVNLNVAASDIEKRKILIAAAISIDMALKNKKKN